MLNRIKNIRLFQKKQTKKEVSSDEYQSNEFKLNITGLPGEIGEKEREQVALSLFKNGLLSSVEQTYQKGQKVFHGKASIRVGKRLYDIEYLIEARKVIYALQAYKTGFDIAQDGADKGVYDKELADITADFFRDAARQEMQNFKLKYMGKKIKVISPPLLIEGSVDNDKEE